MLPFFCYTKNKNRSKNKNQRSKILSKILSSPFEHLQKNFMIKEVHSAFFSFSGIRSRPENEIFEIMYCVVLHSKDHLQRKHTLSHVSPQKIEERLKSSKRHFYVNFFEVHTFYHKVLFYALRKSKNCSRKDFCQYPALDIFCCRNKKTKEKKEQTVILKAEALSIMAVLFSFLQFLFLL